MKTSKLTLFSLSLLLLSVAGCGGISLADGASAGVAGLAGLATYNLLPEDWKDSEKALATGGAALLAFLVSEAAAGQIDKKQQESYAIGYAAGTSQIARQQYQMTQNLQAAATGGNQRRVHMLEIPAPMAGDANYDHQPVYIEVYE